MQMFGIVYFIELIEERTTAVCRTKLAHGLLSGQYSSPVKPADQIVIFSSYFSSVSLVESGTATLLTSCLFSLAGHG